MFGYTALVWARALLFDAVLRGTQSSSEPGRATERNAQPTLSWALNGPANGKPTWWKPFNLNSACQGLLDLLERLALCFRKAPANEQKASQANAGIDPEGSRRPNAPVQQWKRIGKNEAGDPQ